MMLSEIAYRLIEATRVVDTPEFKRWFGNSVVVNDDGSPMVLYHGTGDDIKSFDIDRAVSTTGNVTAVWGLFFTPNKDEASRYAMDFHDKGGNVVPVYIRLTNPYKMPYTEFDSHAMKVVRGISQDQAVEEEKQFRDELIQDGHDGIIIGRGKYIEYVVFDPKQVKSAIGNTGKFDTDNIGISENESLGLQRANLRRNSRRR